MLHNYYALQAQRLSFRVQIPAAVSRLLATRPGDSLVSSFSISAGSLSHSAVEPPSCMHPIRGGCMPDALQQIILIEHPDMHKSDKQAVPYATTARDAERGCSSKL